jgi:chemotaxis family two-component system sensor kinase Cph1
VISDPAKHPFGKPFFRGSAFQLNFTNMAIETRVELTELELEDALRACASEPIHIPGSIQPYGVLFVLRGKEKRIVQVSANLDQFVPPLTSSAVLGLRLCDVIGETQANDIERVIIERALLPSRGADY